MVINFDCRRGAKKSGHLDYPFKSYGPKFVSMHKTCGEVGVQKKSTSVTYYVALKSWSLTKQVLSDRVEESRKFFLDFTAFSALIHTIILVFGISGSQSDEVVCDGFLLQY